MKLTNFIIYDFAMLYQNHFKDFNKYIPAKANFKLQKNINILIAAAEEIDKLRSNVIKQYGEEDSEGSYIFTPENQKIVQKELQDLFNIEQDLNILTLNIDDFNSVEFTPAQMQLLMFMFEE